jgi:hypothetical protein
MTVLIGCEESQTVCKEFRDRGHEAFSCDIQDCGGGYPEWHIKGDVFDAINSRKWDMMIAHPPCTYLTVTGARWMYNKDKSINTERLNNQEEALIFFKKLYYSPIDKICLENPVGIVSTQFMKPTQIIQPYYFGDEAQKTTHLWLKNLLPLYHVKSKNLFDEHITHVGKGEMITTSTGKTFSRWYWETSLKSGEERRKLRSKTFSGIAKAMAEQWG